MTGLQQQEFNLWQAYMHAGVKQAAAWLAHLKELAADVAAPDAANVLLCELAADVVLAAPDAANLLLAAADAANLLLQP